MYWRPLRVEVDPKNLLVSLKDLMRLYALLSSHNYSNLQNIYVELIALSLIPPIGYEPNSRTVAAEFRST